ncbi:MAG: NAD(P)H-quinone oxidoreductase, partial [Bdellovibrionales bacterium]|nr:NAD(P)H-quinone oxidoreductase [Bdellovibrionales bacterium]
HASGVNRADCLIRAGKYKLPPGASPILGVEVSGIVDKVGDQVTRWSSGDRVAALLNGGGYAQWAVAHESLAFSLPNHLSFEEMAAIPEVFLTAFQLINWISHVQPLETVLIHAGASGIGTAAIQIVKQMGAHSIVTVGSKEKAAYCQKLGAKHAILRYETIFDKEILDLTNNQGIDVILDCVGQAYWHQNIRTLKQGGRIVLYGALSGDHVKDFNLSDFYLKWPTVIGTTLFPRSLEYKAKLVADFLAFANPLFEKKLLEPIVYKTFPFANAAEAHKTMEANQNIGKIILNEFT